MEDKIICVILGCIFVATLCAGLCLGLVLFETSSGTDYSNKICTECGV